MSDELLIKSKEANEAKLELEECKNRLNVKLSLSVNLQKELESDKMNYEQKIEGLNYQVLLKNEEISKTKMDEEIKQTQLEIKMAEEIEQHKIEIDNYKTE